MRTYIYSLVALIMIFQPVVVRAIEPEQLINYCSSVVNPSVDDKGAISFSNEGVYCVHYFMGVRDGLYEGAYRAAKINAFREIQIKKAPQNEMLELLKKALDKEFKMTRSQIAGCIHWRNDELLIKKYIPLAISYFIHNRDRWDEGSTALIGYAWTENKDDC